MQILQDFDLIRQGESVFFLKKGWWGLTKCICKVCWWCYGCREKKRFHLLITMTKIMLRISVARTSDQWCYVFIPLPIYLKPYSLKFCFSIHSLSPGKKDHFRYERGHQI
jgi:hypothetical protein